MLVALAPRAYGAVVQRVALVLQLSCLVALRAVLALLRDYPVALTVVMEPLAPSLS